VGDINFYLGAEFVAKPLSGNRTQECGVTSSQNDTRRFPPREFSTGRRTCFIWAREINRTRTRPQKSGYRRVSLFNEV